MTNDTPLTPPPADAQPAPGPGPQPPQRQGIGALGITLAVVGGIVLAGVGTTAAVAATMQHGRGDQTETADTAGVTALDLEVGVSDMTVRFASVSEAELQVQGTRGDWTLDREGDELVVRSPNRAFGWWFGSWFDRDARVTLTLPEELAGIDAELDLNAGGLTVVGDFGDLDVSVGAGGVDVEGSADTLDVDVSAGGADLELADVREAELKVSAGELVAELTGSAPDDVRLEVSAGSLELTVPDELYDVTSDVSAGDFDNRLQTSTQATSTIHAEISAGSATLRAER